MDWGPVSKSAPISLLRMAHLATLFCASGFDSAPIKLTMPFVALGAAKSLVDDFFWSRWRLEISVFDLVSIGRG